MTEALSLGAAAIHFAAAPSHFAEFAPYGLAFLGLAWFQAGWAVASLMRGSGAVLRVAAIAVNGGAVAVWLASRTAGLPFGPHAGLVEAIGPADALATAFEVGVVLLLATGARGAAGAGPRSLAGGGAGFVGVLASVAVASSVALAVGTPSEDHHHGPAVLVPEASVASPSEGPTPGPTTAPSAPSAPLPSVAVSSPVPSAVSLSLPSPASSPAPPTQAGVAVLAFGTRLGPNGELFEVDTAFALGEVVVWHATLEAPIGNREIRFQVIERRPDGREFVHWDEPFVPPDPAARTIVAASDLALYAHDGPGIYVIRYLRAGAVFADGVVTLVAAE